MKLFFLLLEKRIALAKALQKKAPLF